MPEKEDGLKVLIVRESLWQSIVADAITFSTLLISLFVNTHFLGNSTLVNFLIVGVLLMSSYRKAAGRVKSMSEQEALEYLKERVKQ